VIVIKENYWITLGKRAEKIRAVSTETVQNIIGVCEEEPDLHFVGDVIRIVANTGLMNCELLPLRMSDVNATDKWIAVGTLRARQHANRVVPLRPKTMKSIASLHQMHSTAEFILGDEPQNQLRRVLDNLRLRFPHVARGRLVMYSIRMNFWQRLISSGVPLSIAKYLLGHHGLLQTMPALRLTDDQKLEIVRRNIDNFLIEL
jgi:integrase